MPHPSRTRRALGECAAILNLADLAPLKLREVLCWSGSPLDYVYFPQGGVLSTILIMHDPDRGRWPGR